VFAANTGDGATPLALVVAVAVVDGGVVAKVPLAPLAGAVNVTTTPTFGLWPVVTVATNGAAKDVPTFALCGVPLVATMVSTACDGLVVTLAPPPHPNVAAQARIDKNRIGRADIALSNSPATDPL
jgi:hypothetical protein